MRRLIDRSLQSLAVAVLASALLGGASASAFEAHNFIEPPFGSFQNLSGLTVDQSNGDAYAVNTGNEVVDVFGATGEGPAAGPSSFTGAATPAKTFSRSEMGGVAVDNACYLRERLTGKPLSSAECEALDPSNGDIYVYDSGHRVVDKYRLNGSGEYEYLSQIPTGPPEQGITIDSAGDLYLGEPAGLVEFSSTEEFLLVGRFFTVEGKEVTPFGVDGEAVAPDGTIYLRVFVEATGATEVVELKRSSLTGAVEGEPVVVPNTGGASGVAFDQATGQLFVDLGSSGEALNAAHEVLSRFGAGVIAKSDEIAVDEATGEVYVANGVENAIDRFGPGVVAALPTVDAPPPSLSDVTRTSALLSGTVNTGDATTKWQLQYARAGEYQPGAPNPYAAGGSTRLVKLAPSAAGTSVGPVPLAGLLAGTTYDYRLVATNEVGTTDGPDHMFTTAEATPPILETGAAGEVTQTGVLLTGTVDTRELQTSYEFEVGTNTGYEGAKLFGNAGNAGNATVSMGLQFLIPGTTYHYRLAASNEDGTTYGQDMTFTTPGVTQPIAQPVAESFVPVPTEAFPSVEGSITKAQGVAKGHKKKTKKRHKKAKTRTKRRGKK